MAESRQYQVILTGTDPRSKRGGIGFALPGYISALDSANIPYVSIPTYSPYSSAGKHLLFLIALPKILHTVWRLRKAGKVPIVYSHAGANISLFREGVIAIFSRLCGARTVMHIHAPETIGYLRSNFKRALFRLTLIGVEHIFVLTPWWKTTYLKMGMQKPLSVVGNPLPTAWEEKARKNIKSSTSSARFNTLVMTRIVAGKGVDRVVEAVPYLSNNTRVDIAGDGPQLNTLKARVKELMLDEKVVFHGWVSGSIKQDLFDNADIFCHPTELDAMPMNIMEAMANGLPVVALNWGPIPDLVPHKTAGILVEDADPRQLAKAINTLKDPKMRAMMGTAAKQWVLENFTSKMTGLKLRKIFVELIS